METALKLLLFDIDGTLIRTGGAGRLSMSRAFAQLYGIPDGFDTIQMMGRTDPSILHEAVSGHGLPWNENTVAEFKALYTGILADEIKVKRDNRFVCPGITELLTLIAAEKHPVLGILTGNWKSTAMIKLDYFRLSPFFKIGVFADDAYYREDMVPVAVKRWQETIHAPVHPSEIAVIGDTPLDIECARPHGVRTVGVATGFHTPDLLSASKPDLVFTDFGKWRESAEQLLAL